MKPCLEDVLAAIGRDDGTGFCVSCGSEASGVEPDARNILCEACGKRKVFGAEELVFMYGG